MKLTEALQGVYLRGEGAVYAVPYLECREGTIFEDDAPALVMHDGELHSDVLPTEDLAEYTLFTNASEIDTILAHKGYKTIDFEVNEKFISELFEWISYRHFPPVDDEEDAKLIEDYLAFLQRNPYCDDGYQVVLR